MDAQNPIYVDTFFARQPIFGADNSVFGYELLYRGAPGASSADYTDEDAATLLVLSSALLADPAPGGRATLLCVHFSRGSILSGLHSTLSPGRTVLALEPLPHAPEDLLLALRAAKGQGYRIAVNHLGSASCDPALLALADIAFVDVLDQGEQALRDTLRSLDGLDCLPAAKRVEDDASFRMAKALGFRLFQGFFFEKPVIVPGRRLPAGKLARLALYNSLGKGEDGLEELARSIEADVSVSYRLLAFINSVAFGLRYKVTSIRHALTLLGWRQIRSWLWMVLLSEIAPKDKPSELPYLSSIRARFLERTAAGHGRGGTEADTLFLLGLFSLLEPMLDAPMTELVGSLPLDDAVKASLCGEANAYAHWLELAKCFETGDWNTLDALTGRLSLDPVKVATAYCDALVWAKALLEQAPPNP